MKKILLVTLVCAVSMLPQVQALTVTTNGKDYEVTTLIDRDLGPGVRYTRLRLPQYPLNVNLLRIDVTNPYNSVETTQANDRLYGTEALVNAAKRQSSEGHKALAGANANFWCVSGQPPFSDQLVGVTYNGNLKNGKIITELNMHNDQWNGGYKHTGILGITPDRKVYSSNNWTWRSTINSNATGECEIFSVNKVVRDEEMNIYNSYYGTTRTFRCVNQYTGTDGKGHFEVVDGVATEVYLKLAQGQQWSCGNDIAFTVDKVVTNAGSGTVGAYDLVIVGRGSKADKLNALTAGDVVTLNYAFVNSDGQPVQMQNLVGGNAQVMVDGVMTKYATSETYNSQVYSRTGYGTDAENKTLYICVIDKATDPVYGSSAGCSVTVMCDIVKLFGCVNMTNFDAGGSAEMLVDGAIINKTTEGSPRAVANGMIAYSIAPADNAITRLEFYDYALKAPIYASYRPRILGYNQYGVLVNDDVQGVTLSCPAEAGTCDGDEFNAGADAVNSTLTATYGQATVTKAIEIVNSAVSMRIKPVLIDAARTYPIDVTATVDENVYVYDRTKIGWGVGDASVIEVSADGVLKGLSEGTTTLTATIGDFTDVTDVTVEIADAANKHFEKEIDATTWKASGTSTKNFVLSANGTGIDVAYTVSSTRAPKVTLTKELQLYSLPDAVEFTVNPATSKISGVTVNLQPANQAKPVAVTKTIDMSDGAQQTVRFEAADFGDHNDLAYYPVKFRSIAFNLTNGTGDYTLSVPVMHALYNNFTDGVQGIQAGSACDGNDAPAEYYTLQGVRVANATTPGIYIRRQGSTATKILVK